MISDKNNIDQLFRTKLRDYEATPPLSVWERIDSELRVQERARRILYLKRTGMAAAIISAFLAGWWITGHKDSGEIHENVSTLQVSPKAGVLKPIAPEPPKTVYAESPASGKGAPEHTTGQVSKAKIPEYKLSITSMAAFAPDPTLLNKKPEASATETKETALVDVEKELLSHYQNNLNSIKQFSTWITSSFTKNGKPTDTIRTNRAIIEQVRLTGSTKIPVFASDTKKEDISSEGGRWTLSAGLSPITITQRQGGSSIPGQQTSYENTVTGSMLAGYKIGKKIVVKSGIIVSQLKQVTNITDYSTAFVSDAVPFKTASLATISGSVKMDKAVAFKQDVRFSGLNTPSPGTQSELRQDLNYIEIPVQMVYKLIDRKFNVGIAGGVSTNILAGNKAGLYENGEIINHGQTSNLRDVTYSGAVGLELGYDLSSKITLTVEPRIKRFLNSLSSNETIDFKPYQVDIMTGVKYSFN